MYDFRALTLMLGLLGSFGALLFFGVFAFAYLVAFPEGVHEPNYQVPASELVTLYWYLAASLLGFFGTILSFYKPRAGGVVLFVTCIVAFMPLITFWLEGILTFNFFSVADFSWIALLFVAGLLAITKRHTRC